MTNIFGGTNSLNKSETSFDQNILKLYLKADGSIPMNGVLNMNSQKISSLQNPENDSEAVNKKYCDDQINEALRKPLRGKIQKAIEKTLNELMGSNTLKALNYIQLMNTLKPILWLTGYNVNFLAPSYRQIGCLMGSPIGKMGQVDIVDKKHGKAFNFPDGKRQIYSDFNFEKSYTFFLLGQKTKTEDMGRLFSSNLPDRSFGWENGNKTFRLGKETSIKTKGLDTNLHCFILKNNDGVINFWDLDEKVNTQTAITSSENFGKIVIGYPSDKTIPNEKSYGLIYEVIAFDRALSNEEIQIIKDFLKKYYPGLINNKINNDEKTLDSVEEKTLYKIFSNEGENKSTKKSNLANSYL